MSLLAAAGGWGEALGIALGLVAVAASVVASVCDARERIIPNGCCLIVAAAGCILSWRGIVWGAAALALGTALELAFRRISGKCGVGLGDVKLVAAWACVLGWRVLPALAVACLLGALFALVRHERDFALAPWLTLAFAFAFALLAA